MRMRVLFFNVMSFFGQVTTVFILLTVSSLSVSLIVVPLQQAPTLIIIYLFIYLLIYLYILFCFGCLLIYLFIFVCFKKASIFDNLPGHQLE